MGPGWWMASDQKWYPPESYPGYQPPPPGIPAYGTYPGGQSFYPNPGSRSSVGPQLAGYGRRLGGWLIDWVILLVICGAVSAITHSFRYSHIATNFNGFSSNNRTFRWGMPGALLSPLIVIIYGTLLCGSRRAQTLGMMVTKTKAVKASIESPLVMPQLSDGLSSSRSWPPSSSCPGSLTCCFLGGTPKSRLCMTRCQGRLSSDPTNEKAFGTRSLALR
jgi:hypothetical protein